ncbi:hypothetical protein NQ317_003468 [Molorchus minor]|uniref:C2H2-type domain-containing protein n=1 Tax=Molorchus minor TaxID=1323400 RepID=A0ABQ9JZA3_9CUCU|nr:hypothetical protein NQ317_003468 [Molorchus minor]
MSGEIHSGIQNVIIPDSGNEDEELEDNEVIKKPPLSCDVCSIKVTSMKIMQRHLDGRKHKARVERLGKTFTCDLCEITANSETQLNVHLSSSKHKAKLLRKEHADFTDISANRKGLWILMFCLFCLFLNLFLLFKMVL